MTTGTRGCRICGAAVQEPARYCRSHLRASEQRALAEQTGRPSAWILAVSLDDAQPLPARAARPWWGTEMAIAWALILFFPLGLALMWRYATWRRGVKWAWTLAGVVVALAIIG